MRRLVRHPFSGAVSHVPTETLSKRFARKRGASHKEVTFETREAHAPLSNEPTFDLSGLRTSSSRMVTAPASTSLDAIRSEINTMRREAQARAEEESIRQQQAKAAERTAVEEAAEAIRRKTMPSSPGRSSATKQDEVLSSILLSSYRRLHKPSDTFYNGQEVEQGLRALDTIMKKTFLDDVDEVVRPKDKAATKRYMELVFPHLAEPHARSKRLDALLETVESEHRKQLSLLADNSEMEAQEDLTETEQDPQLVRIAWLNALDNLSEDVIKDMWHFGLLDTAVLEDLTTTEAIDERGREDDADKYTKEDEGASDDTVLLDERVQALKRIQVAQEITATIRATHLSNNPSLDLAPVLYKAKHRQYADITDKELRLLEKHEEATDPVIKEVTSTATTGGKANDLVASLKVTEALLNRALNPSNRLLFAAAGKDAALRESLEGLERIKRQSLLDPVFQEAVEFAHALEEESVGGHVRGAPPADKLKTLFGRTSGESREHSGGKGKASLSVRARRGTNMGRGPLARAKHAADVPYFYNSIRSVVPARGSFNLPAPALTKEEKAALRGVQKRARGPTRFSR